MDLSRDRPMHSISLGMAGGVDLPRPIPRETIRREGKRLGLRGDEFEDFVTILLRADDDFVELASKRVAKDLKLRAAQAKKR